MRPAAERRQFRGVLCQEQVFRPREERAGVERAEGPRRDRKKAHLKNGLRGVVVPDLELYELDLKLVVAQAA